MKKKQQNRSWFSEKPFDVNDLVADELESLSSTQKVLVDQVEKILAPFRTWKEMIEERSKIFDDISKKLSMNEINRSYNIIPNTNNTRLTSQEKREIAEEITKSILPALPFTVKKGKVVRKFVLPKGTQWSDMTIKFIDGHTVEIKVKNGPKQVADYREMGFEDKRKYMPNQQWKLLQGFARRGGEISWEDSDASDKRKKYKQLLSDALKLYFGIEEDPFFPYHETRSYRLKINLIL